MCDFHEPYFGANYPDACCIDGYLWDLDSCDEPGGGLTSGGDDPCPQCNHAAFLERVIEHKAEEGWLDGDDGKPREYTHQLRHEQPGDEEACRIAWLKGYDEGAAQRVANLAGQGRPERSEGRSL